MALLLALAGSNIHPGMAGLTHLAEHQFEARQYDAAAKSASEAARRWPSAKTKALAKRMNTYADIAYEFEIATKKSCIVLAKIGKNRWAASLGRGDDRYYSDVELAILDGKRLQRIKYPAAMEEMDNDCSRADIERIDLDRDGQDELVLVTQVLGASWNPTSLHIFDHVDSTPRCRAKLFGDDYVSVEDLDRDGITEIECDDAVGAQPCHAEQPRWHDIYHWKRGKLVKVNRSFPGEFVNLKKRVRVALRNYPDDYELWRYQSEVDLIFGRFASARKAAARSLELVKEEAGERAVRMEREAREILAESK